MRWAILVVVVGCGGVSQAVPAGDAGADPDAPAVVCQDTGAACTVGWQTMRGVRCSGEVTPPTSCALVPGAGPDAGWYYCCP